MEFKIKNNRVISDIFGRLASEKKKTITVLCLFLVMVFMWTRAFIGNNPTGAQAVSSSAKATDKQQSPQQDVEFVDLPYIKGRNDVVSKDFFNAGEQEMDVQNNRGLSDNTSAHINWILRNLKLEAIGLGRNPQAFINGRVFSVGDELVLKNGNESYNCEVIAIEEKRVLIRLEEEELELKFTGDKEIDVTY